VLDNIHECVQILLQESNVPLCHSLTSFLITGIQTGEKSRLGWLMCWLLTFPVLADLSEGTSPLLRTVVITKYSKCDVRLHSAPLWWEKIHVIIVTRCVFCAFDIQWNLLSHIFWTLKGICCIFQFDFNALHFNIYMMEKSIKRMGLSVTHCCQNPIEHYFRKKTWIIQSHTKFTHQHLINISYLTPTAEHTTDFYPESCNWACLLGYQSFSKPRISMKGRIL
jgi:hypothetical protein